MKSPSTHSRSSSQASRPRQLRVLLTNGRFPVSLDLARQFRLAGHVVYCVDPMGTHICTFTRAVRQSAQIPSPHDSPHGYIRAVMEVAIRWNIDLIIPIHEEVFCLAECDEPEILDRLFAPDFEMLTRLHDKHEFAQYSRQLGLLVPETFVCKTANDLAALPLHQFPEGMALKPCLGRSSSGLHHIKAGVPLPEDTGISEDKPYVAQPWLEGERYCSYSIIRNGSVEATGCYPVIEKIDGSGSVFLRQKFHPGVYEYVQQFVSSVPAFSGQIAFDFIETNDGLFAIECNPRATPGVHLWSGTPWLARAITGSLPKDDIERPIRPPKRALGKENHYQVAARMLMWEHQNSSFRVWARHMRRLLFKRDVTWQWRDPMPTFMQPLLLTAYFSMCRKTGLQLPELFQEQLIWDPKGEELERVRTLLAKRSSNVADSGVELRQADSWHTRSLTTESEYP